jgi:hypothetical protein
VGADGFVVAGTGTTGIAGVGGNAVVAGVVGKAGNCVGASAGIPATAIASSPSGGGTIDGNGKSGTAGIAGTVAATSPTGSCGSGIVAAGVSARAGMRS